MPIHSELQQLLTALPAIDLETITIEDLRAAANTPFPSVRSHEPQLAATPDLRRLIVSHGKMMTEHPAKDLRTAISTL